jgi:hypothetical protein
MGYRSEVAYVIKFDDKQTRDAYVTLMLANDSKLIKQAIEECDYDNERDPIITFHAEDVKWYDSYEEVRAHTFIYRNARELGMGSFRFLAVGEDGKEDFEEDTLHDGHALYDYIYAEHSLRTNF